MCHARGRPITQIAPSPIQGILYRLCCNVRCWRNNHCQLSKKMLVSPAHFRSSFRFLSTVTEPHSLQAFWLYTVSLLSGRCFFHTPLHNYDTTLRRATVQDAERPGANSSRRPYCRFQRWKKCKVYVLFKSGTKNAGLLSVIDLRGIMVLGCGVRNR